MTKKTLTLCLLLSAFGLLMIAARPRTCKVRGDCVYRAIFTPTPTLTATATPLPSANTPQSSVCDTAYPNPYIPGTCAHATLESVVATWDAQRCAAGVPDGNGGVTCLATVPPAYPPPAGYP